MDEWPLVTIVTPVLNSRPFIEDTIQSVLGQDYPRLEYIVMDGGSTDGTLEVLRWYYRHLKYYSGPDCGTADAINRGIMLGCGSIVSYLNADDLLNPGAVSAAVRMLLDDPRAAAVYGEARWIDENGRVIGRYPTMPFDPARLGRECFICQPASFIRRSAFEAVGQMDPNLHFSYDYDLWMRMARTYKLVNVGECLACSRMHAANKSLGQRRSVFEETLRSLSRHYGYVPFNWIYSYCCYLRDGRDQFFEPLVPSLEAYLASFFRGLVWNNKQAGRYCLDWASVMSFGGMKRILMAGSRPDGPGGLSHSAAELPTRSREEAAVPADIIR